MMLLFELIAQYIFHSILMVEFQVLISITLYTNILVENKSKKIRIICYYDTRNNPARQFLPRV